MCGKRKSTVAWNGGGDVRTQSFLNRLTINDPYFSIPNSEVSGVTISWVFTGLTDIYWFGFSLFLPRSLEANFL